MSTTQDDIKKREAAPSAEQLAKDRDRVSEQSYEDKNKEVATTAAPYAFHPDSDPNKEGSSANTIADRNAATASQPTDAALVGGTAPTAGQRPTDNRRQTTANGQQTTDNGQQPPRVNSVGSMMDYVNELTKSMMPTEEQLKAEKKRYKRNAVLAAIGDGVAALANLGGTIYGAPHTEYAPTLSTKMQERYEKLRKEREDKAKEIMAYRMRAFEGDRAQANADRNFDEGVRRFDIGQQNNTRDFNEGVRRYEEQRADNKAVREQQQQNWQQTFDANKEKTAKTLGIQETNAKAALKRAENYAQGQADKMRGKGIAFVDGDKNKVVIYENVWKGSRQNVYNAILEDGIKPSQIELFEMNTPAKVDEWIKKNWTKSASARAIMLSLSDIDPATLVSQVQEETPSGGEDYEQYADEEDDYEQYAE